MPPTSPRTAGPRRAAESGIKRAAARPVSEKRVSEMTDDEVRGLAAPAAVKTTRVTLDLSARQYEALSGYAAGHQVKQADVLRELIHQMQSDPELAARVAAEIQTRKAQRVKAARVMDY
jgi:hypothetical protein